MADTDAQAPGQVAQPPEGSESSVNPTPQQSPVDNEPKLTEKALNQPTSDDVAYLQSNPTAWPKFQTQFGQLPRGFEKPTPQATDLQYLKDNPEQWQKYRDTFGDLPDGFKPPVSPTDAALDLTKTFGASALRLGEVAGIFGSKGSADSTIKAGERMQQDAEDAIGAYEPAKTWTGALKNVVGLALHGAQWGGAQLVQGSGALAGDIHDAFTQTNKEHEKIVERSTRDLSRMSPEDAAEYATTVTKGAVPPAVLANNVPLAQAPELRPNLADRFSDWVSNTAGSWENSRTPAFKQRMTAEFLSTDKEHILAGGASDHLVWANEGTSLVGSMLPIIGTAGAAAKIATRYTAARVFAEQIAAKVPVEAAQNAAMRAGLEAGRKAAVTSQQMLMSGTMGGQNAQAVRDEIKNLPDEQLARMPGYQEALKAFGPDGAREAMARSPATIAMMTGLVLGGATSKDLYAGANNFTEGLWRVVPMGQERAAGAAGRIAEGALKGARGGAELAGGSQGAQNAIVQPQTGESDITKGVGEAAVRGGVAGGAGGAAFGAVGEGLKARQDSKFTKGGDKPSGDAGAPQGGPALTGPQSPAGGPGAITPAEQQRVTHLTAVKNGQSIPPEAKVQLESLGLIRTGASTGKTIVLPEGNRFLKDVDARAKAGAVQPGSAVTPATTPEYVAKSDDLSSDSSSNSSLATSSGYSVKPAESKSRMGGPGGFAVYDKDGKPASQIFASESEANAELKQVSSILAEHGDTTPEKAPRTPDEATGVDDASQKSADIDYAYRDRNARIAAFSESTRESDYDLAKRQQQEQEATFHSEGRQWPGGKATTPMALALKEAMRPVETNRTLPQEIASRIPRASGLEIPARAIENRFVQKLSNDLDGSIREYQKLPDTDGGRIISTDEARELSPDYRADRTVAQTVHEPASWLATEMYKRALTQPAPEGKDNSVLFTAGGTGSGKSAASQGSGHFRDRFQIIYDTATGSAKSASKKIDMALAAGKTATMAYVYKDPVKAFREGNLERAMSTGRVVPMEAHKATHEGSAKAMTELMAQYKDNPNVRFLAIDNSGEHGDAKQIPTWTIPSLKTSVDLPTLKQEAVNALADRTISPAIYEATVGEAAPESPVKGNAVSRAGDDGRAEQERAGLERQQAGSRTVAEAKADPYRAALLKRMGEQVAKDYQKNMRPGTLPSQIKIAGDAMSDLLREVDRGGKAAVLGNRISRDFKEKGSISLVGQKISTPLDLATLAQVYRDPRFETLRFYFVKDGEVINHIGVSSRLPGLVEFDDTQAAEAVRRGMKATGADGYWITHNHPSGRSAPSAGDLGFTRGLFEKVPGFKGHVIIDYNEYSVIDPQNRTERYMSDFGGYVNGLKPTQNHPLLGQRILGRADASEIAAQLKAKDGFATVVTTNVNGEVQAIAEYPYEMLYGPKGLKATELHLDGGRRLEQLVNMSGSQGAYVVQKDAGGVNALMEAGLINDAIIGEPGKQRRLSDSWAGDPPRDLVYRRLADTNFVRDPSLPLTDAELAQPVTLQDLDRRPMSTRVPTAVKKTEDAARTLLRVGLPEMMKAPESFATNVAAVMQYPNMRVLGSANTTKKQAEQYIEHVKSNLLWLHDEMPASLRDRAKQWYDGANKLAEKWGNDYGFAPPQVAGAMAVLSPQTPWFVNLTLTERVMDAVKNQQNTRFTPEMENRAGAIFGAPQYAHGMSGIRGKKLSEVEGAIEKAMWVRLYDEAHNPRGFRVGTPEGGFAHFSTNISGDRSSAQWFSLGSIAKAVSILEDGSRGNISAKLGEGHKVRSFFNNIATPNDKLADSGTVDTHAVAAGLLRPLSGESSEAAQNFGGGRGASKSAHTGMAGTYPLNLEGYRRAAAERGLATRELQSITWEAVRGLFSDTFKANRTNVDAVHRIWENYKAKKVSLNEARTQILSLTGGVQAPEWAGSRSGLSAAGETSSYKGELSGRGSPDGLPADVGGGGGSDADWLEHGWLGQPSVASGTATVNVGLAVEGGERLGLSDVLGALRDTGVDVTKHEVKDSNTEPTVVATLSRPLTPEEAHRVSLALKQEAIAQRVGDKGELYGPDAEKWRPFNPDYFLDHSKPEIRFSVRKGGQDVMRFRHWSADPNLTELDPARAGTGVRATNAERNRGTQVSAMYPYELTADQPERMVTAASPHQYVAEVPTSRMYDASEDPDGLRGKKSFESYEKAIKAAGYAGYYVNNPDYPLMHGQARLFEKTKVVPAEKLTKNKGVRFSVRPDDSHDFRPVIRDANGAAVENDDDTDEGSQSDLLFSNADDVTDHINVMAGTYANKIGGDVEDYGAFLQVSKNGKPMRTYHYEPVQRSQLADRWGEAPADGTQAEKFMTDLDRLFPRHEQMPNEHVINGNVSVNLTHDILNAEGTGVYLSTIHSFESGRGAGTKALQALTELADRHGITLTLNAVALGNQGSLSASLDPLKQWYRKAGFRDVPDSGGYNMNLMERAPSKDAKPIEPYATNRGRGLSDAAMARIVDQSRKMFPTAQHHIARSIEDTPQAIQAEAAMRGVTADVAAVYMRDYDGTHIYLIQNNTRNEVDALKDLIEENVGHDGIHRTFGPAVGALMDGFLRNPDLKRSIESIADRQGIDLKAAKTPLERRETYRAAAEEWLAHAAQGEAIGKKQPKYISDAVLMAASAVKVWAASKGLDVALDHNDALSALGRAKDYVKKGGWLERVTEARETLADVNATGQKPNDSTPSIPGLIDKQQLTDFKQSMFSSMRKRMDETDQKIEAAGGGKYKIGDNVIARLADGTPNGYRVIGLNWDKGRTPEKAAKMGGHFKARPPGITYHVRSFDGDTTTMIPEWGLEPYSGPRDVKDMSIVDKAPEPPHVESEAETKAKLDQAFAALDTAMAEKRKDQSNVKPIRPDIKFTVVPPSGDKHLDELLNDKIGSTPVGFRTKLTLAVTDIKSKTVVNGLDRMYRIKQYEADAKIPPAESGYIATRLSTNVGPMLRTVLEFGGLKWTPTAGFDPDKSMVPDYHGKVKPLNQIYAPLKNDPAMIRRFEGYLVALRGRELMAQGREKLLTPDNIRAGIDQELTYPYFKQMRAELTALNKNILDFATQAGVINPESRKMWESDVYVPLYRVTDQADGGPWSAGSLAKTRNPINRLMGSNENVDDVTGNIVRNWSTVINAAIKAHAARVATDNMVLAGVARRVPALEKGQGSALVSTSEINKLLAEHGIADKLSPSSVGAVQSLLSLSTPQGDDVVQVWRDGKREYYRLDDPLLAQGFAALKASPLRSLEDDPIGKAIIATARTTKTVFTKLTTENPVFGIRTLWKDNVNAWTVGRGMMPVRPGIDAIAGLNKVMRTSDNFRRMAAAGATFNAGRADPYDANLTAKRYMQARGKLGQSWDFYRDMMASGENASRITIYERTLKETGSHKLASYEARDLMDYAMRGASPVVQFMVETVPFWGAHVQGMYRTGRSFEPDRSSSYAKLATRAGGKLASIYVKGLILSTAAAGLAMHNLSNPAYQQLTELERETSYHVYMGDYHIRIPKAFESGTIFGTIPEAIVTAMVQNGQHPNVVKEQAEYLVHAFGNGLSLYPKIQAGLPLYELATNHSISNQAPILSTTDQKLMPEEQIGPQTSVSLAAAARNMPRWAPDALRSPKQLQHLYMGYLGQTGAYGLLAADWAYRNANGMASPGNRNLAKQPVLGAFVARNDEPPVSTAALNDLYNTMDEATKVYDTMAELDKQGTEEAQARADKIRTDYRELLAAREIMAPAEKLVHDLNRLKREIQNSPDISPAEKQQQLNDIQKTINGAAEDVQEGKPGGKLNREMLMDIATAPVPEKISKLRKAGLPETANLVAQVGSRLPPSVVKAIKDLS